MTRRLVSASMVMAFALSTSAAFASPFTMFHKNPDAKLEAKVKQVKVNLRNDGSVPVTISAGSQSMTLKAGETQTAKLNAGDKIVAGEGSSQPAGTVLAVVVPELSDATVVLR